MLDFGIKLKTRKNEKNFKHQNISNIIIGITLQKTLTIPKPFVLDALEETVEKLETIFASSNYQDWKWKEIHY